MKLISKLAAATAAAAIGTTGLVAATGTSANAASATVAKSVTYNCDISQYAPLLPPGTPTSQPVTTVYTVPSLNGVIPANLPLKAVPLSAKITLSPVLASLVGSVGSGHIQGTVSGSATFGPQSVPATLNIKDQTITDPSNATVNASGAIKSFTPKHVGANAVSLPSAVTAVLEGQTVQCKATAGSNLSVGTAHVAKVLVVQGPAKVKLGKTLKLSVVTSNSGKAIAKIKGKKVASATVKSGKATLKIKKGLKKGTNKIVVSVGSLKQTFKVKVTK